jgi:alpha-N-arabinofuranosidase
MKRLQGVAFEYDRLPDSGEGARLYASHSQAASRVGKRIFGNFLEHLGSSVYGGLWAQELANPVFVRDPNLPREQKEELLQGGRYLKELFLQGRAPEEIASTWTPGTSATGFGVAVLDESSDGLPFPWTAVGAQGRATPSVGRIDGAVRLQGDPWQDTQELKRIHKGGGPAGIRQGVFLPLGRTLSYTGHVWARIHASEYGTKGLIEVGFCRRLGTSGSPKGYPLATTQLAISGGGWTKLPFQLLFSHTDVREGEPVDFYVRWLPLSDAGLELLLDRVLVFPSDAVDMLDPGVLLMAEALRVSLLRWPGGNFASQYHWRDGVGPLDLRPPRPNHAWNGLEYNFFGTAEFIRFCRRIGAEPQITVNTGTGSPEEAAAWVEYCNGHPETPMGRLRAEHDSREPYKVRLWEVGNETYGCWQVGYHGAEENARRYREFSRAMKAADSSIELIATGNSFDFVHSSSVYDHVADGSWNSTLLETLGDSLDYVSLHSLPYNDFRLETISSKEATYSILAQPTAWERRFVPDLLTTMSDVREEEATTQQRATRLAITEWGILGHRRDRPHVENFGEAVYAGLFFNFLLRNAQVIPIANSSALLCLGYIRRTAWQVYFDAKYLVMQQYARLANSRLLACRLAAPGYDVTTPSDLSSAQSDIPYVDAVVCHATDGESLYPGLHLAAVNRHLERAIDMQVHVASQADVPVDTFSEEGRWTTCSHDQRYAQATPADPHPFSLYSERLHQTQGRFEVRLPPFSVSWAWFPAIGDKAEKEVRNGRMHRLGDRVKTAE